MSVHNATNTIHSSVPQGSDISSDLRNAVQRHLDATATRNLPFGCSLPERTTNPLLDIIGVSTFHTDLTVKSLADLEIMSQNSFIASQVKSLRIEHIQQDQFGNLVAWERDPAGTVLIDRAGGKMLLEIISRFVNCTSFEIYRKPRETRDGLQCLVASDAVTMILNIVISLQRHVDSFSLELPETYTAFHPNWVSADLRGLSSAPLEKKGFGECWASLQNVNLTINVFTEPQRDFVTSLVQKTQNTKHLKLKLAFSDPSFETMLNVLTMPMRSTLESVYLKEGKLASPNILIDFLWYHRGTLKSLTLEDVSLWYQGAWDEVFEVLDSEFPVLKHIALRALMEFHPNRLGLVRFGSVIERDGMFDVTEVVKGKNEEDAVIGLSYTGPRMDDAVKKMRELMAIGLV
ncbi:uncharacterized protein BDV14DRAFT_195446 [Aspergillus stella-maris]|uniref:uncharacterized protein n=1 Tax=Aspergillus stella-maris TaxID=1810926 RepID=UPI003CCDB8EF